jgi:1,6-anhydro-N-acetylmuramate kinase
LNELAMRTGIPFDKNGELAATGNMIPDLLEQMNNLRFYQQKGAKSSEENGIASTLLRCWKMVHRQTYPGQFANISPFK